MYIQLDKDTVFRAVLQYVGIQEDLDKFIVSEIDFSHDVDGNGHEHIDGVRIYLEPKKHL